MQNCNEIPLTRVATIRKKEENNKCWQGCRETGTLGGNVKWYIYYGKEYDGSSKIKNRIII